MKRKTTKELLADSFLELAEKKPINKITIANIADNCELTQPTFYRYFKDKYDMIAWIYAREAGKNISKVGTEARVRASHRLVRADDTMLRPAARASPAQPRAR